MSICQCFYCSNIKEACLTQVFPLALFFVTLVMANEREGVPYDHAIMKSSRVVRLECLTAKAKVATILWLSIPASSDIAESKGKQIKQCCRGLTRATYILCIERRRKRRLWPNPGPPALQANTLCKEPFERCYECYSEPLLVLLQCWIKYMTIKIKIFLLFIHGTSSQYIALLPRPKGIREAYICKTSYLCAAEESAALWAAKFQQYTCMKLVLALTSKARWTQTLLYVL